MGYQAKNKSRQETVSKSMKFGILTRSRYIEQGQSFYWSLYERMLFHLNAGGNIGILEFVSTEEEEALRLPKFMQTELINGLVLMGKFSKAYRNMLTAAKIPFVCLDMFDADCEQDTVISDGYYGMYFVTRHLLQNGHKKIAIINGPGHLSTAYERYRGFCTAMKEADLPVDSAYPYQYSDTFTTQTGYDGASILLSLPDPPTAFVFDSSELAFGGMRFFAENGIQVPNDVSFVCVGDVANRDLLYIRPTLSSVNLHGMGARMAELLLERIQSETPIPNREILFSSTILYGDSVKSLF